MLPLKAALVLSPEFCATKKRQSLALKDVLNVGKAACSQLFAELLPVFTDLNRMESAPSAGSGAAQMILIPKFVDINATQQPFRPSSQRKLIVILEWRIQDPTGRTVWLQTAQGSSEHKAGWAITAKGVSNLVDAAVDDLARDSAIKISSARELRQFLGPAP
jgi:hypothetical protein